VPLLLLDRPNEMSTPMTTMDKQTRTPEEVVADVEVEAEEGVAVEGPWPWTWRSQWELRKRYRRWHKPLLNPYLCSTPYAQFMKNNPIYLLE